MAEPPDLLDDIPPATDTGMPELLTFSLRRAAAATLLELQAALAEDAIRPIQFAIMTVLAARPGLRQSQLSPMIGIRRTNLVPLLSELEARRLCERRPVPGDRRAAALFLTEAGATVSARCTERAAAHETRLAVRIGPQERQHLAALLHRLIDSGSDMPGLEI